MHDYILANLMVQEIDREFERKQFAKYDPDGLAQYEIWDDAFVRPSLVDRFRRAIAMFRRVNSRPAKTAQQQRATECLPQG